MGEEKHGYSFPIIHSLAILLTNSKSNHACMHAYVCARAKPQDTKFPGQVKRPSSVYYTCRIHSAVSIVPKYLFVANFTPISLFLSLPLHTHVNMHVSFTLLNHGKSCGKPSRQIRFVIHSFLRSTDTHTTPAQKLPADIHSGFSNSSSMAARHV